EDVLGRVPAGDAQQFGAQQVDAAAVPGGERNGDGVAVGVVLVLRAARLALLGPVGLAACWSSGAR
ncbi:MAG: hypothetical protein J0L92_27335, partial [Deltaproteobacteria bacterium]|nr:hypothetical protein [Deltaproteobacteria bacterium]